MALQSPLKKDIEKALRDVEVLQRLYSLYFAGGEEDPPTMQRKQLDQLLAKIKTQLPMSSNAADKFQGQSLFSRFQLLAARWDKTMNAIQTGILPKPKRRE